MMRAWLGIGPLQIDIARTRILVGFGCTVLAAVAFVYPAASMPSHLFEAAVGSLIATLLYEPIQRFRVPAGIASTVGVGATFAALTGFVVLMDVQHAVVSADMRFVASTALACMMLGCMFVADRMRTIWRESL